MIAHTGRVDDPHFASCECRSNVSPVSTRYESSDVDTRSTTCFTADDAELELTNESETVASSFERYLEDLKAAGGGLAQSILEFAALHEALPREDFIAPRVEAIQQVESFLLAGFAGFIDLKVGAVSSIETRSIAIQKELVSFAEVQLRLRDPQTREVALLAYLSLMESQCSLIRAAFVRGLDGALWAKENMYSRVLIMEPSRFRFILQWGNQLLAYVGGSFQSTAMPYRAVFRPF